MSDPNTKTINGVPLKEAETRDEKLLLGFLSEEAKRVKFGKIVVEFTIRNEAIVHMNSNEISRSFNFGKL
jgi:hypothetical protein